MNRLYARSSGALAAALLFLVVLSGPALALTVDDVIDLLATEVGEGVILDQIDAEGALFALTADDILDLKRAGASDGLIREMIRREPPKRSSRAWTDVYARGSRVQVNLYYDPFGYHWFGWPYYMTYYDPFPWSHAGFYYAGWWSHRWWPGGVWHVGWRDAYCWRPWSGPHVRGDGRYAWVRDTDRRSSGTAWGRSVSGSRAGRIEDGRIEDGRVVRPEVAGREGRPAMDRRERPSRGTARAEDSRNAFRRDSTHPRRDGDRIATSPRTQERPPREVRPGRSESAPPRSEARPAPSRPSTPQAAAPQRDAGSNRSGWRR